MDPEDYPDIIYIGEPIQEDNKMDRVFAIISKGQTQGEKSPNVSFTFNATCTHLCMEYKGEFEK